MDRRQFIAAAALTAAGCGGGWGDATIQMPAVLRSDLQFTYYLSLPGQMEKTADHTSLFWHAQFYGLDQLETEMQGRPHGLVLDCAPQLFIRSDKAALSPRAAADLHAFFADMSARGLLQRVRYLVPMDEPNLFCASEGDLRRAMDVMKAEAALWPELSGVQYACIYGEYADKLWCLDQFDLVGVDNYEQRSEILTRGAHAELMRALLPHQQVMVIPGAAYRQDPAPFVAYAHSEPRCWGVVPFLWCHVPGSVDQYGGLALEKQDAAAQARYRAAGMLTLNKA